MFSLRGVGKFEVLLLVLFLLVWTLAAAIPLIYISGLPDQFLFRFLDFP